MATREIVTLVCDGCGGETEDITTHSLRLDRRRPSENDLCSECLKFIAAVVEAGRRG